MISLEINGEALSFNWQSFRSFDEVIATIREERSPDEVVSSAWWNGNPISDEDLDRNPSNERGVLAVHTRERSEYVADRLAVAGRYVSQVTDSFVQSVHAFKTGHSGYGNTFLARGIDELLSFVAWYSTIINLESEHSAEGSSSDFFSIVQSLQRACERLVSAQLLESSFTIASELDSQLLPELKRLKTHCDCNAEL